MVGRSDILACVNTETKQVILGYCLEKNPLSLPELVRKLLSLHPDAPLKCPDKAIAGVLQKVFVPLRMACESVEGYALTERGAHAAKAARFSLQYAVNSGMSLYPVFGPMSSKGESSSPENRMSILEYLRGVQSAREIDVINAIGLDRRGVHMHCRALTDIEFISYSSAHLELSGWARYRWVDGKDPSEVAPVNRMRLLTSRVAQELSKGVPLSKQDAARLLKARETSVSPILSGLERQGFATSTFKGGERVSQARLLDKGRAFCEKYGDPINTFLRTSELPGEEYVDDCQIRENVRRGMELYRRVSPQMNRMSAEECVEKITQALAESGDAGLRPRTLATYLGWSRAKTASYLKMMRVSGQVEKRKEKNKAFYYLPK